MTAISPTIPCEYSRFELASTLTGRNYRIDVFRPGTAPPPQGYPVLYTTDASMTFRTFADQLAFRQFVDLTPAVIVGIGYPHDDLKTTVRLRMRDLIPDAVTPGFLQTFTEWCAFGGATVEDAGGAELFYRFLVEELTPVLESKVPIDISRRTLYGHSLGGLFALHVLFHHPESFATYAISSPSIIANDHAIEAHEATFRASVESRALAPRVLFLVGALENYLPNTMLRTLPEADLVRIVRGGNAVDLAMEMAARLRTVRGGTGYEVRSVIFDGENHLSVIPASISRALTYALGTGQTVR